MAALVLDPVLAARHAGGRYPHHPGGCTMSTTTRIRNVVFSLATALSLCFGVAQAFAAPGAAAKGNTVRACNPGTCSYDCTRRGYYGGMCMSKPDGTLYCYCIS